MIQQPSLRLNVKFKQLLHVFFLIICDKNRSILKYSFSILSRGKIYFNEWSFQSKKQIN